MQEQTPVSEIDLSVVDAMVASYGTDSDAAIPILLGLQDRYGYLPLEALRCVAEKTNITAAQLYGVATFYSRFRLQPVGKHIIRICHGTSCHVRGVVNIAQAIGDELNLDGEGTTEDMKFTVEKVACLGCCSLSPVIMIDETVYGGLTRNKARKVIKRWVREEAE
jgi:NADH:ubiquinone oxidoreductase subunit E